ncbi:MAG TPA: carbohydrate binding domain-containing protein [Candidatus Omnitrophota bacterium]|nr:carbohydrate binding domain-containing protein [Candidatus Omnitrophota bacterium]HQB94893.1 carbohydrate binding domain-containing protein [Candidatus Omnitrophota bacterium]
MKMFKLAVALPLVCLMVLGFGFSLPTAFAAEELVIADFDTGDKPNNIGGDFGGWDKDPNDDTQGTVMSFATDDAKGDPAGYSIRLDYDVDSPNPAYNGFWMKMNGEDATPYNTLCFFIKGDAKTGYTKRVKLELKDMSGKASPYIVSDITDQWQKVCIPFEKFRRIENWNSLNEFVVVFDDINSNPKTGTIFIDQVSLERQ